MEVKEITIIRLLCVHTENMYVCVHTDVYLCVLHANVHREGI